MFGQTVFGKKIQSKVKIGFWIWIVRPVFSFQSELKKSKLIYQEIKSS